MKSQVATTLEQFKGVKDQLQSIEQQAPELYTGVLAMLDCMLNLSKAVFGPYEQNNEQEGLDDQIVNEQDNEPQEESVGGHPVLEASEKPLGKPFPRN